MPTIPSIPTGLSGDQLVAAINDRLIQIATLLPASGAETADLDMGQHRIINLADPQKPQDAVNLRTLRKNIPATSSTSGKSTTITQAVVSSAGYYDLPVTANTVQPDLAYGLNFRLTLAPGPRIEVLNPIWTGGALVAGLAINLYVVQDAVGHRPTPSWGSAFGNDVLALQIDGTPDTQSGYALKLHPKGSGLIWRIDGFVTRQPL